MLAISSISLMLLLPKIQKHPMSIIAILVITALNHVMKNSCLQTNLTTHMDFMSFSLIILNMWIIILMLSSSLKIMFDKTKFMFMSTMIILLISLNLSFSINSPMTFFFVFEMTLLPTMVLILKWGYQPERIQAGNYFILYTMTASLPLLTNIIFSDMFFKKFFYIPNITQDPTFWISMTVIMAFLAKAPMFFTHLWLPKAHVEAPVAGSMILAGVLLKLGTYGAIRFMQVIPHIVMCTKSLIISISMIGAMLTSMICARQQDMKSLIAYSSVAHMGMALVGIFSNTLWGWKASLIMMLAHGLASSAMFFMANASFYMSNSRALIMNKGNLLTVPYMSLCWFMCLVPNMGTPPFLNYAAEIPLIMASINFSFMMSIPLSLLLFFSVMFSMYLYTTLNHGPKLKNSFNPSFSIPTISIMMVHIMPLIITISNTKYSIF